MNNNVKRKMVTSSSKEHSREAQHSTRTSNTQPIYNGGANVARKSGEKDVQEGFSVLDLKPETHYLLRMTAHNSAGSTISTYEFTTLTFGGATVAPELIIHSEYSYGVLSLLANPNIILPILLAIVIIVAMALILGHQLKKDHSFMRRGMQYMLYLPTLIDVLTMFLMLYQLKHSIPI